MRLAITGDGLSDGTDITPENTGRRSGTKADIVFLGTGTAIKSDSSLGAPAIRVQTPGGQNAYVRYQFAPRVVTSGTRYASIWLYFTGNPGASTSVFYVGNENAQRCLEVRVISSGLVQGYDSTGTARTATSVPIPHNQWFRVDVEYTSDASNGSMQLKLYSDPYDPTPTDISPLATGLNLRQADRNEIFFGTVNGSAAAQNYLLRGYWSPLGPAPFSQGFALSGWVGNVTTESATVVARTVMASSVRLVVSTTPDLATSPIYSSAVTPDSDGVARLDVTGLDSDTQYYWGLELDGDVDEQMYGSFRTFPETTTSFSFAAASCAANWSNSPSFDAIRNYTGPSGRKPLFFVHLGDLHYINPGVPDTAVWHAATDQALTPPRPNAFFRNITVPYTWSDHDSSHSNTDGSGAGLPGAQAVYRSRVPHYPLAATDGKGIYHSFPVGDKVLCIVTDGRSYMDPIDKTDDENKTKLGAEQKAWLKSQLSDPNYPVKIWFHEDAWNNGQNTYPGDDTWTAYSVERQEIADYINSNGIKVAYICGDLHVLAADDGTNSVGGFPVHVCSPLDQTSYVGNGTYSAGTYPTYDSVEPERFQQFGIFDVDVTPTAISLTFKGMDATGNVHITQTTVWSLPAEPGDSPFTLWDGTTEVPLTLAGVWNGATLDALVFDEIYEGTDPGEPGDPGGPAAPGFLGAVPQYYNATSFDVQIPMDAERVVACIAWNGTTAITPPPGWELIDEMTTASARAAVFTIEAQNITDTTFTHASQLKTSVVVLGYSSSTVLDAAALPESAADTTHTAPELAVPNVPATVVRFWWDKASTTTLVQLPAGVTERAIQYGTGPGSNALAAADEQMTTAGTAPARDATFNVANQNAGAFTIALVNA